MFVTFKDSYENLCQRKTLNVQMYIHMYTYMLMEKCRKIIVGLNITQRSYLYFVKHVDIKGTVDLFIDLIT